MPQALTTIMQKRIDASWRSRLPVEHERRYRLSSCHAVMHGAVAGEMAPLGGGPDRYRGNHGPRGRGRGRCLSASRDRFRPPRRDPVHGQGLFERFSGGTVWLRQAGDAGTVCLHHRHMYIERRNRAAPQVCQRLKRWLRPYPPRHRSSIPRSGPRCAAQVHGVAPWSTRRRIVLAGVEL